MVPAASRSPSASPAPAGPRGPRLARWALRWGLLTVLAVAIGGLVGTGYALMDGPPPIQQDELRRGDIWPPTAPVPTGPEDGAFLTNLTPTFTWLPSEDNLGYVVYEIEFSKDRHFQTGVWTRVMNVYEPHWQTPDDHPFAPGVTYYWRVFAIDLNLNIGPYSEVSSFQAVGVPPAPTPPEPPEVPVPPTAPVTGP